MVPSPEQSLKAVQRENERLKHEMLRSKKIPSNKLGIALIIIGALPLSASIIASSTALLPASLQASSTTLAFIGLALTFWGILFIFARPTKFVRSALLGSTVTSSYKTIDRIIDDLNYKGKSIYIPPYPEDAYLPEHLIGLKELIIYISSSDTTDIPTIEEIAKKQFLVKNPKGICITPPGSGLVSFFEDELQKNFAEIDQDNLYDSLQTVILNNLELASDFEIKDENELIHVKITNSVYKDLYSKEQKLKSVYTVGCPLVSAIACALAKATGKPVTMNKSTVSPDLMTIEAWYQIFEV